MILFVMFYIRYFIDTNFFFFEVAGTMYSQMERKRELRSKIEALLLLKLNYEKKILTLKYHCDKVSLKSDELVELKKSGITCRCAEWEREKKEYIEETKLFPEKKNSIMERILKRKIDEVVLDDKKD